MTWKASCVMDERVKFAAQYLRGDVRMAELCRCFGICRRVGYKWVDRYEREGVAGLEDRSRAPHHHPNAVPAGMEAEIVARRRKSWWMQGVRRVGRGGILNSTVSTQAEHNAADACHCGVVAGGW